MSWRVRVESPLGVIGIEGDGGVQHVRFAEPMEAVGGDPLGVADALGRYFSGEHDALKSVPIQPNGTDYQQRVWQAVRAIPAGETRTYGELATELQSVARAVGGANGANPIALFVPCHRVVGAGGALTGFAWGVERKAWLLKHESRTLELFS